MRSRGATILLFLLTVCLSGSVPSTEIYVAETSGIRWNDVGGVRWNDVGGVRWNDVGGVRWNDVGGVRWNDVGGVLFTEASGIRWNDVGGIRWNDVGGLGFTDPLPSQASLDLVLLSLAGTLPDSSFINVVVTFHSAPSAADLARLGALGIPGGTVFRRLPMVVVNATRGQIASISRMPSVRSVYSNRTLSFFDEESRALIGLDEVAADTDLSRGGASLSGAGVTIAVVDTGVDATHPDLRYGSKVIENVRLMGASSTGPGFVRPARVEGVPNTDLVLGHGTFVASVAAGTGEASGGIYRGAAPGAKILGLSAGDVVITSMLESFDYILENASRFGVRVVNCSWGTQGFFDPDDPVNVATRLLHDAGIVVVFAAGNHGPSPDTLNPYAVAPWVIGVGSTAKDGTLSSFSSRGIFEELLYHPTLVAPGEGIIAATPAALSGIGGVAGVADPPAGTTVPPEHAATYTASSGTSFAAPHVAAVAALMLEADPTLTPRRIKEILQRTSTPILTRDRSQVGAGRLDAWAAVTQVIDPGRPFGTHIPGWLDQRPYRIVHEPALVASSVVPAGGAAYLPAQLTGAPVSWQATLAWGTLPGLSDLDLRIQDSSGAEIGRSDSFNGASLFGRAEGIHLLGAFPTDLSMEVVFKDGTGVADQSFQVQQESAVALITGYCDLDGLSPSDHERVALAVSRHVMVGEGDRFEPARGLKRGELARALALAAGLPQRIPALRTFADVGVSDPAFPYVETVAGQRSRKVLMERRSPNAFGPQSDVDRIDFAVSLVRAAGGEQEAMARAGEALGLVDEAEIPADLTGYVAVALQRALIETVPSADGPRLEPRADISRLAAAKHLLLLLSQ